MKVTIKEVTNRRLQYAFVHFPYKLYKGNEYWVPALIGDEYDAFNPKKNAAYEFCDAKCFLAYDETAR